jgi:hypothetical protein
MPDRSRHLQWHREIQNSIHDSPSHPFEHRCEIEEAIAIRRVTLAGSPDLPAKADQALTGGRS